MIAQVKSFKSTRSSLSNLYSNLLAKTLTRSLNRRLCQRLNKMAQFRKKQLPAKRVFTDREKVKKVEKKFAFS